MRMDDDEVDRDFIVLVLVVASVMVALAAHLLLS